MSWCCCDLDTVDLPTPVASAKGKPPTNVISVDIPVVPKPITLMIRAQEPIPVLKIIPQEEKKTMSVDDDEDVSDDEVSDEEEEGNESDSESSTLYPDGSSLAAGACLMIYTLATIYMNLEEDGNGGITLPGLNAEIP